MCIFCKNAHFYINTTQTMRMCCLKNMHFYMEANTGMCIFHQKMRIFTKYKTCAFFQKHIHFYMHPIHKNAFFMKKYTCLHKYKTQNVHVL